MLRVTRKKKQKMLLSNYLMCFNGTGDSGEALLEFKRLGTSNVFLKKKLSRGQEFIFDDDIAIRLFNISHRGAEFGFRFPKSKPVYRTEVIANAKKTDTLHNLNLDGVCL